MFLSSNRAFINIQTVENPFGRASLSPPLPKGEEGSALVYILIAIALLAALTVTFMEPSSQQTSSQNVFKTLTSVESQANVIRSAIQECVLSYPQGDPTINNLTGGSDPGARKNYPLNPDSTHYTTADPGRSGDQLARNIRCPGNNPGAPNQKNHEPVFSGNNGKYLPPKADLFEDWQYYNGTDGVFFWTETSKTDEYLVTALTKLDDKFAECEADIIDARSGPQDLDSEGTYQCPDKSLCFRVRLLTKASAPYNGDTDGDEAGCQPPP